MRFGKRFCSKNLRDTVLAIWVSFQNSRGTALAIWDLGRVSFQSKLRDTVLAIWYLGKDFAPKT